jgi:enamine deaminase RidA (YjgF/YER057c/UK114 family)
MFNEPYPARSAFEIGNLAADIRVEIEAIAVLD